ncbi:hypothetical protein [Enterococcus avium]|uniref:hypothetical protein n=1 Tax=Enterococcus avium TaxID=33945 RepID=UPI00288DF720|nr:hypothetical protein [Enterococcus avium]MDT2436969.1 hypothetical protein [Enterococcus avium]
MSVGKIEEEFQEELITFRIAGDEMNKDDGYDLNKVLESLSSFEAIVTKTYLFANNKQRFTKEDQEKFSIKLMEVNEGSWLSVFNVIYTTAILPSIPVIIENKEFIWGAVKTSYDFLKAKISAEKEGKTVSITQTADNKGINISNTAEHTTINVYQGIPSLSEKLSPSFERLANSVDGKAVSKIEMGIDLESDSAAIEFTEADKEVFRRSTATTNELIQVVGKMVDGDYKNQKGKLEIQSSSDERLTPMTIYNFSVAENLQAEHAWKEMFLEVRPYYCNLKIEFIPSNIPPYKVLEVIISDWDEKNWNM